MASVSEKQLVEYRFRSVPASKANWSEIHHFGDRNYRKSFDYGSPKELKRDIIDPFVEFGGWRPDVLMHAQKMSPEDQTRAVEELKVQWTELREAITTTEGETQKAATRRLQAFEWRHVQNGRIHKPTLEGIDCYRRAYCFLDWVAECRKLGKEPSPYVNVAVPDNPEGRFLNPEDREAFAALENSKQDGFRPVHPYCKLLQVYNMVVGKNKTAGWMERNLGIRGSDRVIYYHLARCIQYVDERLELGLDLLQKLNPEIQFLKDEDGQILKDEDGKPRVNPEWWDIKMFKDQKIWQGRKADPYKDVPLGPMTDVTKNLEKFNKRRLEKSKPPVELATPEFLREILPAIAAGKLRKNPPKIMEKAIIEQTSTGENAKVTRDVAKAVLQNDTAYLDISRQRSSGLNYVYDCDDQVYPTIAKICQRLKKLDVKDQVALATKMLGVK